MQVHSQVVGYSTCWGGEGGVLSLSKRDRSPPGYGPERGGGGGGPLQWTKYESTKSHKAPSGLMQRKLS